VALRHCQCGCDVERQALEAAQRGRAIHEGASFAASRPWAIRVRLLGLRQLARTFEVLLLLWLGRLPMLSTLLAVLLLRRLRCLPLRLLLWLTRGHRSGQIDGQDGIQKCWDALQRHWRSSQAATNVVSPVTALNPMPVQSPHRSAHVQKNSSLPPCCLEDLLTDGSCTLFGPGPKMGWKVLVW